MAVKEKKREEEISFDEITIKNVEEKSSKEKTKEETKKVVASTKKNTDKNTKQKSNSKKKEKVKKESWLKGVVSEFKKVRWPNKKEMTKYSIATIAFILFFAAFFYIIEIIVYFIEQAV